MAIEVSCGTDRAGLVEFLGERTTNAISLAPKNHYAGARHSGEFESAVKAPRFPALALTLGGQSVNFARSRAGLTVLRAQHAALAAMGR
jgi:hypothetical protein